VKPLGPPGPQTDEGLGLWIVVGGRTWVGQGSGVEYWEEA
jgi:hypothetical protein